ncbi:carboxylating nicotinate-nucleotide diphosphorylase [Aureibacillus halotolerans]|uniref:Probable nicotinate-nucleotide pyrophosphorylase [carboxylating] n=1 Tax=Aureibacillus halotolerans TaxID=1508390 RepID=A0A4R6UAA9_9BACI|nr:carboxylating nicotinate-nucleotide diphosphorylase [Aureibacillus halotolerans]TDQ42792.1 nicotinate-nucleotide pyrophosphorylase [carboxylating] [Aureibacillus halotolerans]
MQTLQLKRMLEAFLEEDLGHGDITSQPIASGKRGKGQWIAKEEGVFAGKDVIDMLPLLNVSQDVTIRMHINEGDVIEQGTILGEIEGPLLYLLETERVILNLVQRMSGIATLTNRAARLLNGSVTRVCDTRKTTPGLRMLEKHAVVCGGGVNQRFGLYDGALIKDNHIALAGSVTKAIELVRGAAGHLTPIQVEVETYSEFQEALKASNQLQSILFDNVSPETLTDWLQEVPNHLVTEASGAVNIEDLPAYRPTGVHFVSLGKLTHSAKSLDISFNLQGGRKYGT